MNYKNRYKGHTYSHDFLFNIERLKSRIEKKSKKLENGCTIWTGTVVLRHGEYGRIWIGQEAFLVTRVIWYINNGKFPIGLICHTCDNTRCIEILHLFEGNNKMNQLDSIKKGRHAWVKNGHIKAI